MHGYISNMVLATCSGEGNPVSGAGGPNRGTPARFAGKGSVAHVKRSECIVVATSLKMLSAFTPADCLTCLPSARVFAGSDCSRFAISSSFALCCLNFVSANNFFFAAIRAFMSSNVIRGALLPIVFRILFVDSRSAESPHIITAIIFIFNHSAIPVVP